MPPTSPIDERLTNLERRLAALEDGITRLLWSLLMGFGLTTLGLGVVILWRLWR